MADVLYECSGCGRTGRNKQYIDACEKSLPLVNYGEMRIVDPDEEPIVELQFGGAVPHQNKNDPHTYTYKVSSQTVVNLIAWAKAKDAENEAKPESEKPIVDLVTKDLSDRSRVGMGKYGKLLKANNGRNSLKDAYEEALDLAMYLKQAMVEQAPQQDEGSGA